MKSKKTGRRKVFAVLIVILLVASWLISFFGLGSNFGNLGKQLKYGLDINGGVYVLLEADTPETGTELAGIMNQTKSVLDKLQENSGGTAVFADKFTPSELQSYLAQIEKDAKSAE